MTPIELTESCTAPLGMDTRIVAIDGFGGAGKSTLAGTLGHRVVHTDDFASWDNPLGWWPRLLAELLVPLSENRAGRFRRFDWETNALAESIDIAPGGVVIVEGVSASRAAFRPYLAASIWIDASRETRLRRGLERDGASARTQWLEWMAAEDAWAAVDRPREHADLIVSGE